MTALQALQGLGPAKAASLLAAFELARRIEAKPLECGQLIRNPVDVHRHFQPRIRGAQRESFHVLLLDVRHRLMGEAQVSVGTLTASLVHPREVFQEAIRAAAAAVLLVHNHPSGDPTPSEEDRVVTERLAAAGELLGIRVVDHLIIADTGHFSFREAGEGCFAGLAEGARADP
jgi:DNA repair protein RadC